MIYSNEKQCNRHIRAFKRLCIEEKKFLDNLSLKTTACEIGISTGHLSRIINTEINISFSDYINVLRVEEAKTYLINPKFSKYTIAAIGLEAGFNSKSTFNDSFKKIAGCTPSEFKKGHLN
ncbi:AraC-like DNA-binding protein [Ulvibacter sp. MAR_2010_11]|uniref:helix-turn-helix domain-containing protein n=1 Tax=Ulvibacter sp. MAR_2010_11 TaxID=1250229 RepID=UPI000CA7EA3E|nr:helix-turn-helix domain-containing protein [Ulvibacter sp. MAR_2010_11]PKA82562.1 AraC-like DNA-binding protein [Ulvibacter sp. MAR_2010_11]